MIPVADNSAHRTDGRLGEWWQFHPRNLLVSEDFLPCESWTK